MITSLHIENIAVVKSLDIEIGSGFTVLTGETGAGKSIIIDSLNLLLGCRADKELIRSGEEKALVSAICSAVPSPCKKVLIRGSPRGKNTKIPAIPIFRCPSDQTRSMTSFPKAALSG